MTHDKGTNIQKLIIWDTWHNFSCLNPFKTLGTERSTALVIVLTLSILILKLTITIRESKDKKWGKGYYILWYYHAFIVGKKPHSETKTPSLEALVNIGLKSCYIDHIVEFSEYRTEISALFFLLTCVNEKQGFCQEV